MRRSNMFALTLLFVVATEGVYSSDANYLAINEVLAQAVRDYEFPSAIFEREIESGLPNNFHVYLSAEDGGEVISIKIIKYSITYDLWDENYKVIVQSPENVRTVIIDGKDKLIDLMSDVSIQLLIPDDKAMYYKPIEVKIKIVYNPLDKDKIHKILTWVDSQEDTHDKKVPRPNESNVPRAAASIDPSVSGNNTVGNRAGPSSQNIGIQLSANGPKFRMLFNQILKQQMEDSQLSAQWIGETKTIVINIPEPDHEN